MIRLPIHSNTERPEVGLFSCRNYGLVTPSLPIFHGRYGVEQDHACPRLPLFVAKAHKWLLALTWMVVIDVLPVVAVATVGHETTHPQDHNAATLRTNCPRGRSLRRCHDAAARRYCCLHRLFSCVSRCRAAPDAPPRAANRHPGQQGHWPPAGALNGRGGEATTSTGPG